MSKSNIIAEIIFWFHFAIVFGWFTLFLIPVEIWRNKIIFHFILTVVILVQQLLWGLVLSYRTDKFGLVCVLTTAMHVARGERIDTELNYSRRWCTEFSNRFNLIISSSTADVISLTGFLIVSAQYFIL